ncbi:LuxR C-terminal-related transcriptional regulator [Radicibacter daui]|uniref:LuxR C-terminal-related transcriptional regulator n=1 Tax=Radicibacter daui TaxID=3064829 RepID=UPI004046B355
MKLDLPALFQAFAGTLGRAQMSDRETGETFQRMMAALARFDHVVVFAYRGKERPIDLYKTFDEQENIIYVTLYQAGPYLLDPFYHTARARREGLFRMKELAPDRFFSSEYYRSYYDQTGLAEEIGFFVPLQDGDGDITLVLSLMRKRQTGPFPPAEFSLLRQVEPLVTSFVRQFWSGLGPRFDAQLAATSAGSGGNGTALKGKRRKSAESKPALEPADAVWRELNLTPRETAIVDLVLQGHSSESISLKLDISTGTVKVHRRNVYRKLGISSQMQLLSIYLGRMARY